MSEEHAAKKPPKLSKKAYEQELVRLQAELVQMQQWVVRTGARLVIVMEAVSYTHLTLPTICSV